MADSSSPPAEAHPGFLRAENPADAYLLAHGSSTPSSSSSATTTSSAPPPSPPPSHLQPPENRDQQEWIWIAFDPDQLELILAQIDSL
ncbi:hypothetical protein PtB15_1B447 [Puccinia triticina]|nr:hypothetical protein PtB15_1B447 [Puccinia triticina]